MFAASLPSLLAACAVLRPSQAAEDSTLRAENARLRSEVAMLKSQVSKARRHSKAEGPGSAGLRTDQAVPPASAGAAALPTCSCEEAAKDPLAHEFALRAGICPSGTRQLGPDPATTYAAPSRDALATTAERLGAACRALTWRVTACR